jgi:hypothetical protein
VTRGSIDAMLTAIGQLRSEVRRADGELSAMSRQLERIDQQVSQLRALHPSEEPDIDALRRLESILDVERASAHVRTRVGAAALARQPVPHLVVSDLLPADIYEACLGAVPDQVFFKRRGTGHRELRIPSALAPLAALATLAFVAEVLTTALSQGMADRFYAERPHRVRVSPPRLVVREAGYEEEASESVESPALKAILDLGPTDDGAYGSRVCRGEQGRCAEAREIPFRGNSALIVLDHGSAHRYSAIPATAADLSRCSLELSARPQDGGGAATGLPGGLTVEGE